MKRSTRFCPGGTYENSPAIYRWDSGTRALCSPGGTGETPGALFQSSLRDFRAPSPTFPAINRWAIFSRPCGTVNASQPASRMEAAR